MTPQPRRVPAVRDSLRSESAHGYLTSSFELRAGLDVSLVAIGQLPVEVLRELHRLRSCWGDRPGDALLAA